IAQSLYKGAYVEECGRWHRQAFGERSCAGQACPDRVVHETAAADIAAKGCAKWCAGNSCALKSYSVPTLCRDRSYPLILGLSCELMNQGALSPQPRGPLRDELGAAKYRHEAIAAIMRISFDKGLQVMAHRRERAPFAGKWALPSGPLEVDETIEQSIRRHIGVPVNFMEQLSTHSALDRDPFDPTFPIAHFGLSAWQNLAMPSFVTLNNIGSFEVAGTLRQSIPRPVRVPVQFIGQPRSLLALGRGPFDRTIATAHVGLVAWDELSDASFVDLDQDWAFDHGEIVAEAVARLRGKLSYTNIAFALCPEEFTLAELARAYESVLGYPVAVSNLQRVLKRRGQLELTGNLSRPGRAGGRPAKQFRFVRRELVVTDPFAAFAPAAAGLTEN